jgi:integrase/recombinase XerC
MELFFAYLRHERRFSPHTLKSYEVDLGQFSAYLRTTYELENPAEATHHLIRSWLISLVQKNLDPRSVARKVACLRTYYRFLLREGTLQVNPMQKVVAPKVAKKVPEFIPEDALARLLDGTAFEDTFEGWRDRAILELLYGAGMRRAELVGLRHQDLNLYQRTVRILGKGNKERIVPLPQGILTNVERYIELKRAAGVDVSPTAPLLVTDKMEALYPEFVYRAVRRYLRLTTTAPAAHPHALRHSLATHLLNRGADLNAIKEILGHASLAATQVYTHAGIERLKSVFDKAHPKA